MKKLKVLLLLLSFSALTFAFRAAPGNDNFFTTIAFKLYEFYAKYPQEKIYLHHDKNLYSLGETIWFKTYLTLAPSAEADTLSKIVYIDLVSPANKVVFNRKLHTAAGTAHGDMYLPDTLAEGTYQLRAYTNWMRNFSSDYFFRREITIVNPDAAAVKAGITFRTRPHSTGDSIVSTLVFYQLPFAPLPHLRLNFQLTVDGKKQKKHILETDEKGQVQFAANLPKTKSNTMPQAVLLVEAATGGTKFSQTYQLPQAGADLDLQFFPESGNWLTGTQTRLAFKAIGRSGKGKDVAGSIYDETGNKVTDFKSEHLGMGQVQLTAEKGKTYEARVTQPDGTVLTFPLPQAQENGVSLSLAHTVENGLQLKLLNHLGSSTDSLFLVAHAQGKIFYAAKANPNRQEITASLPLNRIPAGLVYFTVFNRAGKPLAERLAFVNMPDKLNVAITTNKQVYGQREQVNMQVTVKDAAGNPVAGNFSLAVRDSRNAPEAAALHDDIYTYTYLSSELKGHIEQPNYYFDTRNPNAIPHLDLLLLTQGWRRFSWEEVLQDKQPAITHFIEKYISISGVVEKEFGRNKEAGVTNLSIISSSSSAPKKAFPAISVGQTAADGSFYIGGLHYYDTLQMFIQARTPKGGKNLLVKRNVFTSPATTYYPETDTTVFAAIHEAYLHSISTWTKADKALRLASGAIMLGEVEVKADREKPDTRRLHSKDFTDATINVAADKVVRGSILEYLVGVAGVQVSGAGLNTTVSIRGGGTPTFILDGMQVDLEFIQSLPPTDVETIELLKGANASVYGGANGAIVIFTKRGNPNYDYSNEPASGTISFRLPGYNKASEFYVPRYDVPDERHNLPDFRNTLHWQPTLTTNAEGKAELSFFTSDDVTSFTATCEGFTGQGAVGAAEHSFKVAQKR
ncbi:TonB-dependent receptor plug domain-containing protein [Botryobacter ruber]|uniref:TonB-dependent receptor plug domain-containing protein n=1 Tax=Botryobacter ruber TaxID=2171629 RepID=UPI000E0B5E64|nr:TonB-dependent receptor plug domain-containing protein [Botryobacter ruber]